MFTINSLIQSCVKLCQEGGDQEGTPKIVARKEETHSWQIAANATTLLLDVQIIALAAIVLFGKVFNITLPETLVVNKEAFFLATVMLICGIDGAAYVVRSSRFDEFPPESQDQNKV